MTSKAGRGGRRTAPYAFTEEGVAMLSSMLRGPRAVRVNIEIIRVFVRLMSFSALTPGNKLSIKWHGHLQRPGISRRPEGKLGNYLGDVPVSEPLETEESDKPPNPLSPMLSEDDVKRRRQAWLEASGWQVSVADRWVTESG